MKFKKPLIRSVFQEFLRFWQWLNKNLHTSPVHPNNKIPLSSNNANPIFDYSLVYIINY